MREVPRRRDPKLRDCLLRAIHAQGGIAVAEDLRPVVAKAFHFRPRPDQKTKWETNVSFALIDLRSEGFLECPFGKPGSLRNRNWILVNRHGRDASRQVWCLTRKDRSYNEDAAFVESLTRAHVFSRRQGWRRSIQSRKAIEDYAMRLAFRHYSRLWPKVIDVSDSQPFDLHCQDGSREMRVEVKGTTSLGHSVLLTRNEVLHAQENRGVVALFLVSKIRVSASGSCCGGKTHALEPWDIRDDELKPIAFECRLDPLRISAITENWPRDPS